AFAMTVGGGETGRAPRLTRAAPASGRLAGAAPCARSLHAVQPLEFRAQAVLELGPRLEAEFLAGPLGGRAGVADVAALALRVVDLERSLGQLGEQLERPT